LLIQVSSGEEAMNWGPGACVFGFKYAEGSIEREANAKENENEVAVDIRRR
jgi:hypothetical protein